MSVGSFFNVFKKSQKDFRVINLLPMLVMHIGAIVTVYLSGFSWVALGVCVLMYYVRMFGITAGFHRYFAHRSYKTSRFFQFVMAWIGTSATQLGPIWWAGHHRDHHKFSDTERDVHSPVQRGFWWAHIGWLWSDKYNKTKYENMKDFENYPELLWINKYFLVPPVVLAVAMFGLGVFLQNYFPALGTSGLQMLAWGFFASTVILYHGTFLVNSATHMVGKRVYPTTDDSRNSMWIALVTMGEGWHNNHHFFPSNESQGLEWWQIDMSHYVLTMLSWVGIVWDIKRIPRRLIESKKISNVDAVETKAEAA
ncbi:MAG: acyl-CoA desaturase [Bdellovibrionales bacterium]|nr:acyl-CoA desaturase [Bdellovibrionales bacterium]